ncbi:malate dehydrogenase [Candidatus Kaiserbacteria bacterium RIFCSPLOWO2_02_FULL_54_13]|uniref:Malate dehydrogenase n=1 Tax=Candidatus Kaiserbacteria bacterium RIFCSPHIGHO2_02_FULL_54_22 TaxID=1798495 RepID=A0A1F6DKN8_9BACT|nr:MAG: malate dehydrogenase [Candidatus Kaiserbacteria bacterium RIFCSPHIGHO2_02_FULL_54_22]OGG67945.1 MAG: malate dehydrogenase [Candidatus Kaiserbacteria bacterium RIFCSPHIGHO2_12_FULL_54_16]OGG82935.1 MAG: malate dehydrogenase [Candidatus Kaiserbacteria bacterium RIFCSPLOWO2_02_FULL_54_13]OGG90307.1 MAG: malate dehydrogenase [Candidatus Kaiserbacteria bacterium RIFCSPLOWO2_12_FULL_54_10]
MNQKSKKILAAFKRQGARIETKARVKLKEKKDFSLWYTPGVGVASLHLAKHPGDARLMSVKKNSVAVVSDGSAVLGLGNIGPYGALPVMEGKALIFKEKAGVDAWPLVLATQDADEIVRVVKAIAPAFGGINLEDIAAPKCFDIETRLINELDIPVMHDDQHGTAIVVLAGLINSAKVVKKDLRKLKIVISGAGAAGTAVAKLLLAAGVRDIVLLDRKGTLYAGRSGLNTHKAELARLTNPRRVKGGLALAMRGADVFIGVSGKGLLKREHVASMAPKAIVFAMANPDPEILPEAAKRAGAMVIATGRSDFPNQINNALVFPGIFRGALDKGVQKITEETKLRAARALAALVGTPTSANIIPDMLDPRSVRAVARAVR